MRFKFLTTKYYHVGNNDHDTMDDFFPHYIFSTITLQKAFEKNDTSIILFVFPILCLIRIFRDSSASRLQRLKWCYISLFIFLGYLYWLKSQCANRKKKKKKEDYPSIFKMDFCIDASNYLVSVIQILGNVEETFSIGQIGTITSEHLFARLRYMADKEQTVRSVKKAFNKVILLEILGNKKQKIKQRICSSAKLEQHTARLSLLEIKYCAYTAKKNMPRCWCGVY